MSGDDILKCKDAEVGELLRRYYGYRNDTPIDYWGGALSSAEALAADIGGNDYLLELGANKNGDDLGIVIAAQMIATKLAALFSDAEIVAKELGWDGDIREGPFFGALPNSEGNTAWWIGFKQDNNGTTFIISPHRMSWLESDCEWKYLSVGYGAICSEIVT